MKIEILAFMFVFGLGISIGVVATGHDSESLKNENEAIKAAVKTMNDQGQIIKQLQEANAECMAELRDKVTK